MWSSLERKIVREMGRQISVWLLPKASVTNVDGFREDFHMHCVLSHKLNSRLLLGLDGVE